MATNGRTVNIKVSRYELLRLMTACTCLGHDSDNAGSKKLWYDLHDKLEAQLDEFDQKHAE